MRRNTGGKVEFIGLNTTLDPFSLAAGYAIRAEDVFIDTGRPRVRLGRLELSEDQLPPTVPSVGARPLGLFSYATPSGEESVVLVRTDGIFQRKG